MEPSQFPRYTSDKRKDPTHLSFRDGARFQALAERLQASWHWNAYANVQLNYIHCMLDNFASGASDGNIYVGRFQLSF